MCVLRDSKDPINVCLSTYHYVMFEKLWSYLCVLLIVTQLGLEFRGEIGPGLMS